MGINHPMAVPYRSYQLYRRKNDLLKQNYLSVNLEMTP